MDGTVETTSLRQAASGTEEHGHVTVMAASMHLSRNGRTMLKLVELDHIQGIHIRAKSNGSRTSPNLQRSHYARFG